MAASGAVDKYTVELKLKEKVAIVNINLAVANNFAAIYPKEIAEKFPPGEKATEYVGTGPFKLVEWKPDQYIQDGAVRRLQAARREAQRLRRRKVAYVDEIRWIPGAGRRPRAWPQMETGRAGPGRRPDTPTPMTG